MITFTLSDENSGLDITKSTITLKLEFLDNLEYILERPIDIIKSLYLVKNNRIIYRRDNTPIESDLIDYIKSYEPNEDLPKHDKLHLRGKCKVKFSLADLYIFMKGFDIPATSDKLSLSIKLKNKLKINTSKLVSKDGFYIVTDVIFKRQMIAEDICNDIPRDIILERYLFDTPEVKPNKLSELDIDNFDVVYAMTEGSFLDFDCSDHFKVWPLTENLFKFEIDDENLDDGGERVIHVKPDNPNLAFCYLTYTPLYLAP